MRSLILILLLGSTIGLNAQKLFTDNSDFFYQISPVYNFKRSIVSLSFDDGYLVQFTIGMTILKERNLPATFYVITDRIDSIRKKIILDNYSNNFEIGSHTVTHPDLVKIGNTEAYNQLSDSKLFLQKNFGMNSGLTMSYPWGIYDKSVEQIAEGLYLAARSTDPGYNSVNSPDRYALKMQNFDARINYGTANSWVDFAMQNHLWLIEMLHGINKAGYSAIDSVTLALHLDYIKKSGDVILCSNVENVIKYIEESKKAGISCEMCDDSVYQIRINDFLSDSIFDQPLSIRIKIPANWDSISVSKASNIRTENINKNKFILFNALPDNQLITIRPGFISIPKKESGLRFVYLSANPFIDKILLTLEALDKQDIDIVLCSMNGKLFIHKEEKSVTGVINLVFDTSTIGSGLYFLNVRSITDGSSFTYKLVKI